MPHKYFILSLFSSWLIIINESSVCLFFFSKILLNSIEIECFTLEESGEKASFDLIFIMYMINYYIASDYQKIVRDIIFYMYLISVHFETYALAGPNAELFYGDEFQLHANSQIEGQDYA